MASDQWDDLIRRAAADYHRPPAVPREEMWRAIVATRRMRRRRAFTWTAWGTAVAATLVLGIGIGIGRWTSHDRSPSATVPDAAYRVAATQHLDRVEALLTGFQIESRTSDGRIGARFAAEAADLLASTRLMLDSPAARDPRVRALLEDLELTLAQIADLRDAGGRSDVDLINQGLDQRSVLLRLRTAAPAAPLPGGQGAL